MSVNVKEINDSHFFILGLSHKIYDFYNLDIKVLDEMGKEVGFEYKVKPFNTKKNVSSVWGIEINSKNLEGINILSLCIRNSEK